MSSPALFNGSYVKLLKDQLKFFNAARILTGGENPQTVAKEAETGSLYMKQTSSTVVPASVSTMSNGTGTQVMSIAVFNGQVYAGGDFNIAGGGVANYLAKYDGTSWSQVGTFNGQVRSLCVYNNELYIGGDFTNAGGITGANYLVKWNGTSLSLVGAPSAVNASFLNAMEVYNGELILGGLLYQVGALIVNNIAKWNGTAWGQINGATGLNSRPITLKTIGSLLYVGGYFLTAGGITGANYAATWNGTAFGMIGSANTFNGRVTSFATIGTDIYIGGAFSDAGGVVGANNLVKMSSGGVFSLVGQASALNAAVTALCASGSDLYLGGSFNTVAGNPNCSYLAKWNGTSYVNVAWNSPSANNFSNSIVKDSYKLYFGGPLGQFNGITVGGIALYSESYTVSSPTKLLTKADDGTTTNWREVRRNDDFTIRSVVASVATIAGGSIQMADGRVLSSYDGAGSASTDFETDLSKSVTVGANQWLYIDLSTISSSVTQSDTGARVYPVTAANIVSLATSPESSDPARYVFLGQISTSGSVVNTPAVKANFPVKCVSPVVYTNMQQSIGSVGSVGQIKQGHELVAASFPNVTTTSWYNLDSANDENLTQAKNLTAQGTPAYTATGILGTTNSAMSLNGSSMLKSADTFFAPGDVDFVMGAWFNATNWATAATLFSQWGTGALRYKLAVTASSSLTISGFSSVSVNATVTLPTALTGWNHIAMSFSAVDNSFVVYVNGAPVGQLTIPGNLPSGGTYFGLGGKNDTVPAEFFTGSVDECFFRVGTTTPEQIRKLASFKLAHNQAVAGNYQSWAAVRTTNGMSYEMADKVWVVDQSDMNSVYIDLSDLSATDQIEISLTDKRSISSFTAISRTFDSGWLSSVPSSSYTHGLSDVPTAFSVMYEYVTGKTILLPAGDYVTADSTNVYVDVAAMGLLTIGSSNKIRIVAATSGQALAVSVASASSAGLISLNDQVLGGGNKTFAAGVSYKVTGVTAAYSVALTDHIVRATGATTYAVTLPSAAVVGVGREFVVKSVMNAGVALTVNTTSAQLIDGYSFMTLARFESLRVISNGTGWDIV